MGNTGNVSEQKVIELFNKRALLHKNENAVLDAFNSDSIKHSNVYHHFLTKQVVKKYLRPNKNDTLLDFGCGVGRFSSFLSPIVKDIYGVDTSIEMINVANDNKNSELSNVHYFNITSQKLPLEDQTINKIFSIWVMGHINDDDLRVTIKEMNRVLDSNGELFLFEQVRKVRQVFGEVHIQRTSDEYIRLIEEQGFKITFNKLIIRSPSYAMSLWNRLKFAPRILLPLFAYIESMTINRKPQFADFYTNVLIFKKL